MTEKIETIPHDIGLNTQLTEIHVCSEGMRNAKITCLTNLYEITYQFDHFHGYENRDEFFDRYNAGVYFIPVIPGTSFSSPVSFVASAAFKHRLSAYEQTRISSHTKLWIFISINNFVQLYSDHIPVVEIRSYENVNKYN